MDEEGYFPHAGAHHDEIEDHHLNIFEETSFCPNHLINTYQLKKKHALQRGLRQSEYAMIPLYRGETEIYMRLAGCFKVCSLTPRMLYWGL